MMSLNLIFVSVDPSIRMKFTKTVRDDYIYSLLTKENEQCDMYIEISQNRNRRKIFRMNQ